MSANLADNDGEWRRGELLVVSVGYGHQRAVCSFLSMALCSHDVAYLDTPTYQPTLSGLVTK